MTNRATETAHTFQEAPIVKVSRGQSRVQPPSTAHATRPLREKEPTHSPRSTPQARALAHKARSRPHAAAHVRTLARTRAARTERTRTDTARMQARTQLVHGHACRVHACAQARAHRRTLLQSESPKKTSNARRDQPRTNTSASWAARTDSTADFVALWPANKPCVRSSEALGPRKCRLSGQSALSPSVP